MKILHLEDTDRDAEFAEFAILEKWPDCQIQRAVNRAGFESQLCHAPDLILSDFHLGDTQAGDFNGLAALRLARQLLPDTPFVFLSGTIGEERAVDALRAGATDYVIKDRPQRLIPVLERALKDAVAARERAAAAEQLLRVQRLENIGMLAAGIAHDINNVLAPVLMGAALLRTRGDISPADRKILANMEKSAARGAGLVKQILGFAHGVTGAPQIIQPKHLIRDMVGIMQQTFPKNVVIADQVDPALWPIKANPTQFHQVILNLCVNARDAMPAGGTLTIRAMNHLLDEAATAAWPGLKPGDYFSLQVSDTGGGIPDAIRDKIWEPFFTTKGEGGGTGLGLATVRGIIAEHQGLINLAATGPKGTTFHVLLPAVRGSESETGDEGAVAIPRGNDELLLVAEDDTSVREVTCATLAGHGYRVQAASDGTDAVSLFAMRSREIRVVVTDIDMPNLDGAGLAHVVTMMNPAVRVLLVSGSTDIHDPRRRPPPGGKFLAKPFTAAELLGTVHELLQEA